MKSNRTSSKAAGSDGLAVLLTLAILALGVGVAQAQTAVTVPGTATGGFGGRLVSGNGVPVDGDTYTGFVAGFTFRSAQKIEMTATGTITLAFGQVPVGPDGIVGEGTGSHDFHPLEEQVVDAGGSLNPAGTSAKVGGLIGAFVPLALESTSGFAPYDEDTVPVGIPTGSLFLVGSGPLTFSAPGPGTLYFGINDSHASSNAGSFEVELVPYVDIDIKPGSDPNSINCSSKGVIPVAILGSSFLPDVTQIDQTTIHFGGVNVQGKKNQALCQQGDVNLDGYEDLICHIPTWEFASECSNNPSTATLEATTFGGTLIRGEDSIRIVPDN